MLVNKGLNKGNQGDETKMEQKQQKDKGTDAHSNCLTMDTFLTIIKSADYQQILTDAVRPLISGLQKKISSLEYYLKKAKNTIRIQDIEIIKLKTDVSKVSKNVDDLDKQVRI